MPPQSGLNLWSRPLKVRNPIRSWRSAEPLAPMAINGSRFSDGLD
jgi:hypothetical protein